MNHHMCHHMEHHKDHHMDHHATCHLTAGTVVTSYQEIFKNKITTVEDDAKNNIEDRDVHIDVLERGNAGVELSKQHKQE